MESSSQGPSSYHLEIHQIDPESQKKISEQFSDGFHNVVGVGPHKMIVPEEFIEEAPTYKHYEFRKTDVLVMGYPRSGTTMTQELLWLIFNDYDLRESAAKTLIERVPLLESRSLINTKLKEAVTGSQTKKLKAYHGAFEVLKEMTMRRVIKTHLHLSFLPNDILTSGCKIIYVARNPKDVVVSLYHLQRHSLVGQFRKSFPEFCDLFLNDLTLFAPYWRHLKEAWDARDSKNVLFLFYEEFLESRRQFITKVTKFLDVKISPFQMDFLDYCMDFKNFKRYMGQGVDKEMYGHTNQDADFVRRGTSGEWKKHFTPEMTKRMNTWIEMNLKDTGIVFPEFSS